MRKALVFILLFFVLDWTAYTGLRHLYRRTNQGEGGGLINYALAQEPQVLILGSSRAKHHIMPSVIASRTSRTAFNAGVNGQDFLYSVMLLDLWQRRHAAPQAILLHVDPESFVQRPDEIGKAAAFSLFYGESPRVTGILLMRSRFERLKYACRSYRFNGKVLPILKNSGKPQDPSFDGFVGLAGSMEASPLPDGKAPDASFQAPWDVKLEYFHELVEYCRLHGTRLFLVHSPTLRAEDPRVAAWARTMENLAASNPGVRFIDISERTYPAVFANKPNLFKDTTHLNAEGARIYSDMLARELRLD